MLTEEQKEQRLDYVCGSDAAIICDISKWTTPFELWMQKTRRSVAKDISENPAVKAGNMLEEAVRKWFEHETGKKVGTDDGFLTHAEHAWMAANIDGRVEGENAIFEAKTARSSKGWGPQGVNTIPDTYLCQVAHYCAVTDSDRCYVAVLIGGVDFRHYVYERDIKLEKMIISREETFYTMHMKTDLCPDPVTAKDVLLHLNNRVNDDEAIADADVDSQIDRLVDIQQQIKNLEISATAIKDKVCVYMGENQNLLGLNGELAASWRLSKPGKRLNPKLLMKEKPEIFNDYTETKEGSRRFLLKRQPKEDLNHEE